MNFPNLVPDHGLSWSTSRSKYRARASPSCVWSQTLYSVMFIGAWWDFIFLVTPFMFVMGAPTGLELLGEVFSHGISFPHGKTCQWPNSSSQIQVQVVGLCCTCPRLIEHFFSEKTFIYYKMSYKYSKISNRPSYPQFQSSTCLFLGSFWRFLVLNHSDVFGFFFNSERKHLGIRVFLHNFFHLVHQLNVPGFDHPSQPYVVRAWLPTRP